MSLSRLEQAIQTGILPLEHVRASLGKIGASAAEHLLASDVLPGGGNGFEVIDNAETKAAFERAFELSEKLAGYIDLSTPTPEDMAEAGVDYAYLAGEYERMKAAGLEPHIVLAPHGLGLQKWHTIFTKATADKTIPDNPLRAQSDGDGLWVSEGASANWHAFDRASKGTTTPGQAELPSVTTHNAGGTASWTIRIIPGKQIPDSLNQSYITTVAAGVQHQTVPEMLTDKLTTIMAGGIPSDKSHYSWCDSHGSGAAAPQGFWNFDDGRVSVVWDVVVYRYGGLGSRPPVG